MREARCSRDVVDGGLVEVLRLSYWLRISEGLSN